MFGVTLPKGFKFFFPNLDCRRFVAQFFFENAACGIEQSEFNVMFPCISVSPAFPVNHVQVFINRLILGVDVCLTNEHFQFADSGRSEMERIAQPMKGRTGLGEPGGKVSRVKSGGLAEN